MASVEPNMIMVRMGKLIMASLVRLKPIEVITMTANFCSAEPNHHSHSLDSFIAVWPLLS